MSRPTSITIAHGDAVQVPRLRDDRGGDSNPYHRDYLDDAQPLPHDFYAKLLEDYCHVMGFDLQERDELLIVRYLLFHQATKGQLAPFTALTQTFSRCMPHVKVQLHALWRARAHYWNHPLYGSLPEKELAEAEKIVGRWRDTFHDTSHSSRNPYDSEEALGGIGEAIVGVMELCDVSAATLYAERASGDGNGNGYHPAMLLLRGAIAVRLHREAKAVSNYFHTYLKSVEAFEAGLDLHLYCQRNKSPSGRLGSYTRPGARAGQWAVLLYGWIAEAKKLASQYTDEGEDYLDSLTNRPLPSQKTEAARIVFLDELRRLATAAGYPKPSSVTNAMYRTLDPYSGRTYGRSLLQAEKTALLWHFGHGQREAEAGKSKVVGTLAASDALQMTFDKISDFLKGVQNLPAAVQKVHEQYPGDEEPPLPAASEVQALQKLERDEQVRKLLEDEAKQKAEGGGNGNGKRKEAGEGQSKGKGKGKGKQAGASETVRKSDGKARARSPPAAEADIAHKPAKKRKQARQIVESSDEEQ